MKTLILAVDNSPVAKNVTGLAGEQALAQQASVLVLCCVDPTYSSCNEPFEMMPVKIPVTLAQRWMSKTPQRWWCATHWLRCFATALKRAAS